MENIEKLDEFKRRYEKWSGKESNYPFVKNSKAPFTPVRRALPMLNLGLITSAGAYIDGTDPFNVEGGFGDTSFRELPIEIEAEDIKYASRGYDPAAVLKDRNSQIPIDRLLEYEENAVIGRLNHVWWSLAPNAGNAGNIAEETAPQIADRLMKYNVQAALLIPAALLCHQNLGIVAREIESRGIPTMLISVDRGVSDLCRPPRTAYYDGKLGSVAGEPLWSQFQRRILDESLRWIETLDQPTSRRLVVNLETKTEVARGEK